MLVHTDKSITGSRAAFHSFTFLFETSLRCMLKFTWFQALTAAFFQTKFHKVFFLRTGLFSEDCFQIMASEAEVTELSEHLTSSSYSTFPGIATCFSLQKSKSAIDQEQLHNSEIISVVNHFRLGKKAGKVGLQCSSEIDASIRKACSS